MSLTLAQVRRALHKPPSVVLRRVAQEAAAGIDRLSVHRLARAFDADALLKATDARSLDQLWDRLAARPFPCTTAPVDAVAYEQACPGDAGRILTLAQRACAHQVDLLGSGMVDLGPTIDWLTDQKSGYGWPRGFMRDIDYLNVGRGSDVKFVWELSRLQWLIPAGQAFLLTGDERYAAESRAVIDHWITENPCALTVNWSCTMEAALRIVTWSWFFHVFGRSTAWADRRFRLRFLQALFSHGRFTARYLEHSDVNGNHCTADAAGLVFAGLFFGEGAEPARWLKDGTDLLDEEIQRQVTPDGVDFEGSVAYHRLVAELFVLPAMYRKACGLSMPAEYRARLHGMAQFTAAYSRADGTTPLWGDADDGRMLPFGGQALNDHRYLPGMIAAVTGEAPCTHASGSSSEMWWACGPKAVAQWAAVARVEPRSGGFPDAGYFVMRNERDHVFIDCAPVGLAGRGGHGHSDCLSFEAALNGVLLISDCGAYVYTSSPEQRNLFRSTSSHNTPRVAGLEINRLVAPDNLWQLHPDAVPDVRQWQTSAERDTFTGSHAGYRRLQPAVRPVRTIMLDHRTHTLRIDDTFEGDARYDVEIPLHVVAHVDIAGGDEATVSLLAAGQRFQVRWEGDGWVMAVEAARVSPSYGVVVPSQRLVWRGVTSPASPLTVWIEPAAPAPDLATEQLET